MARSQLSGTGSESIQARPEISIFKGKRALVRRAAERGLAIEQAESELSLLAELWAQHARCSGVLLAFGEGRWQWRAEPPAVARSQWVGITEAALAEFRSHLSPDALSAMLGFEYRRIVLNARLLMLRSEQAPLREWSDHLQALRHLFDPAFKASPGELPADLEHPLTPRHPRLGDPRRSPFRGKRALYREFDALDSLAVKIEAAMSDLVIAWRSVDEHGGVSLRSRDGIHLKWRARQSSFGHQNRFEFFSHEMQSVIDTFSVTGRLVIGRFEFLRCTFDARHRLLRTDRAALQGALDELAHLEHLAPEGLRTPLYASDVDASVLSQPLRRPFGAGGG